MVSFRHKEIAKAGSRRKRRNVLKKRSAQFRLVIGKGDSSQVVIFQETYNKSIQFNSTGLWYTYPSEKKKT